MSTRSMILEEQKDGRYLGIYCHHDGYLTHNGAILLKYYNTRKKLEKLLELGELSYLAPKVKPRPGTRHDFDHRQDGVCVFYGRDRGEIATGAEYVTLEDLQLRPWIEFTYVYGLDNKWRYFEYRQLNNGLKEISVEVYKEVNKNE